MRTKNRPIEVLAPAGSMECLKAAILNGADAVYLGGEMFGARAYAGNFNKEELLEAIDYVHLYGKKLFLTVNTLMKEEELPLLPGTGCGDCTGFGSCIRDPKTLSET